MALFNQNAKAVTFEEYITDYESEEIRAYLTGYADAIHNNTYMLGGCPRKLYYRPYGEYFQHLDIYIAKKTKSEAVNLDIFYAEPVEPFLTAVILKYTNCNNPESQKLEEEPKEVQKEIREIARQIIEKTKKVQTPHEREKDFAYEKHLDRLNNPKKYECPKPKVCKICPKPKVCPSVPKIEEKITKPKVSVPIKLQKRQTPKPVEEKIVKKIEKAPKPAEIKPKSEEIAIIPPKIEIKKQEIAKEVEKIQVPKITEPAPQKPKKNVKITDVKAKKYELDSLEIDLDNLHDVKLPEF